MADTDDIQRIVDAVAEQIGRSVAVDDPAIRLIAASRHFGDEDPVRVRSVLDRHVSADVVRWVTEHGTAEWTAPGRMRANPELRIDTRLCVPVRCNDILLGYLWLIDRDDDLGAADIAAARESAEAVGVALYRRMLLHERERSRTESLVRLLLSPEKDDRTQAIAEISDQRLLAALTNIRVVVIETNSIAGYDSSSALAAALEHTQRAAAPRLMLFMSQHNRGVLICTSAHPLDEQTVTDIGERIGARFRELTTQEHGCITGISANWAALADATSAHQEARTAARAARLLPIFGEVASWRSLGPFALLLQIDLDQLTRQLPFPGVTELLTNPAHHDLVASAEEFLDRAGDVAVAAKALHVHRATLYHRLKRIEEVTGMSMNSGLDRLTLHLALKLVRLTDAQREN